MKSYAKSSIMFAVLGLVAMVAVISSVAIRSNEDNKVNEVRKNNTTEGPAESQEPKREVKRETRREDIEYEKKAISDDALEYGKTEIRTQGKPGVKAYIYEVEYTDGKETGRTLVEEKIEKEPVAEITAIGTKIIWRCIDVTSYDRNPYNDNKCTSTTGEVRYVSDYQAEALDATYRAGKSGAYYYNNK